MAAAERPRARERSVRGKSQGGGGGMFGSAWGGVSGGAVVAVVLGAGRLGLLLLLVRLREGSWGMMLVRECVASRVVGGGSSRLERRLLLWMRVLVVDKVSIGERGKRFMLCWCDPKDFGIKVVQERESDGNIGVTPSLLFSSSIVGCVFTVAADPKASRSISL